MLFGGLIGLTGINVVDLHRAVAWHFYVDNGQRRLANVAEGDGAFVENDLEGRIGEKPSTKKLPSLLHGEVDLTDFTFTDDRRAMPVNA